jgi:hypothetical protein
MRAAPSCPRCGGELHPPGLWSSDWQCHLHGAVPPVQPPVQPSAEVLHQVAATARVPLWLPWPLPHGWLVTGVTGAGDERTGARAGVMACTGPAPLGGVGELLLVAEEPGVGFGAHLAGLDGPDPGEMKEDRPPDVKIHAAGHPTAMWCVPGPEDRAVYVGEASGCWLWAVLWPDSAGFLLMDEFVLTDLRDAGYELDVPLGSLSPRLSG